VFGLPGWAQTANELNECIHCVVRHLIINLGIP
jgi:hypothetical protein